MSDQQRLRILIVTPSLPYPLIWGFGIRVYEIIKYLAARHDVSVVAYAGPNDAAKTEAIRALGARVHPVLRSETSTTAKRGAQFSSLLSPESFQRRSLNSPEMQLE